MSWEVLTMKSRTLSSKGTLFQKNITRFLPFWVLYILCLLLGLMILAGGEKQFYVVMNMGECARIMALVNCGYALLVAQLLFGDLFDARMCSGLHCLPLRREEIFGVNILSGILFSLIPTMIMAAVSLPLMLNSAVAGAWQMSFLWLAAANLEFLFFYGLAILCVFLTGTRFSMAVVYGILNIWSLLLMLVVKTLYMPLLQGVSMRETGFMLLCPVMQMMNTPLVIVSRLTPETPGTFRIEPSWGYLGICAGIGILLMLLALVLYKRRKLETAGEFIAVRSVRPAFLVVFSLVIASGFEVVSQIFFGYRSEQMAYGFVFSTVGLIAGWFVGCMLLQKSLRVFYKRSWLGAGILTAILLSSFLLAWLDPLGIRSWTPQWEDVAWVRITDNYDYYQAHHSYADSEGERREDDRLTDREAVERTIRLHELALEQNISEQQVEEIQEQLYAVEPGDPKPDVREPMSISVEYTMKNGSVRRRFYYIWCDGESGELARWLFSRPEIVFGADRETLAQDFAKLVSIEFSWDKVVPAGDLTEEDKQALLDALLADCRESHLAQVWALHDSPVFTHGEYYMGGIYLNLNYRDAGAWLNVFGDSRHTLQWIRDRGVLPEIYEAWRSDLPKDP